METVRISLFIIFTLTKILRGTNPIQCRYQVTIQAVVIPNLNNEQLSLVNKWNKILHYEAFEFPLHTC